MLVTVHLSRIFHGGLENILEGEANDQKLVGFPCFCTCGSFDLSILFSAGGCKSPGHGVETLQWLGFLCAALKNNLTNQINHSFLQPTSVS
jgi:hypothetical protein